MIVNTTFTNNYTLNVITGNVGSILRTGEVTGSKVSIYPNPVSKTLFVNGMNVKEAKVFDASGKLIPVKNNGNDINVENLPKGNYLIQLEDKTGKVSSDKFIKN